jgi:membrane protein
LLSLFPFFLLALALLARVTADVNDRAAVLEFVLQYFPAQFEFITKQLDAFRGTALTLGVAGTAALMWGALGVFGAISTAVNYAWGVEKQRSFWKHKLFSFVMMLVAGLILLIALLLVSASQMVGASWFAGVLPRFPGLMVLRGFTVRHATTLLFIVVVGFIYYFVPNAKVRFRDVWIGAVVTGLLWKGALEGFSWYVRDMSRFTRVNGSIAAVVVFLVWVYIQAVILLYGVEFTAAYARLRRGRPDDVPAAPAPRT